MDGYDNVEVLNVSKVDSRKEWIIDSGCSFHMCPTRSRFETYIELDGGHVIIDNNTSCKVLDIRTIRLKMFDGMEKLFQEVRYIPKLKRNLISLDVLDKVGYTVKTESRLLKVTMGSLTLMKGVIKNWLIDSNR